MWFKVDDGLSTSKAVLKIPRRYRAPAMGLWVLAGAWCAREETDGFVPEYVLEELSGTDAMARQLVSAGLWEVSERPSDGSSRVSTTSGWEFRKWASYQPTKAQLEKNREIERERKRVWRESRRDTAGTPPSVPQVSQAESGHPVPTRPDPSRPEAKASVSAPKRFDEWWNAYDHKIGRKKAETAYRAALKKPGVTEDMLIAAAVSYIAYVSADGKHPQFTKHPSTWLNGEHWNDERTTRRPQSNTQKHLALAEKLAAGQQGTPIGELER